MKQLAILLLTCTLQATVFAQSNALNSTGNAGIGTTTPADRLSIRTSGTGTHNLIAMEHADIPNSLFFIGSVTDGYPVVNQRLSNIVESYRDLRLGAANAGSIYFETGRTFTTAPVRMLIGNNGNVGVGTESPVGKFHVNGIDNGVVAAFTYPGIGDVNGGLKIVNGTASAGSFVPTLIARSYAPGRQFGLSITGESEDIVPPAIEKNVGAIILEGRSKAGGPLALGNVLALNNYSDNLLMVKANGNVGIGTMEPGNYKLAVEGTIGARKVKVTTTDWADFVFYDDYALPSLADVSRFIRANRHLPGIPAKADVQKEGVDLGEMNVKLLQKIEELTLYLIEMKQENEGMKVRLNALEKK